jgi:hypothetical protein
MIYLFNSGSRPLYAIDALSSMALSEGATVLHRYRARGDHQQVHPDLLGAMLGEPPRRMRRVRRERDWTVRLGASLRWSGIPLPKAERVVVLFVDRYGESGYVYHPLRLGTLYDSWQRDDRVFFRVRLDRFIAAPEGQAVELTDRIRQALADKNPPTLVTGDPDSKNDGHYAVQGVDIFEKWPGLLFGESAWVATVQALSATRRLGSSANRTVVFLRSRLQRLKPDANAERPVLFAGAERIAVRKDWMYELRISYRCPAHFTGSGTVARLEVRHGDNLQLLEAESLPINAEADDLVVPITTRRYTEDRYSFLRVSVQPPLTSSVPVTTPLVDPNESHLTQPAEILGPRLNLLLALREGRGFWLKTITALVLFVMAGLVYGLSGKELGAVSPGEIPRALWAQITWPRIVAAVVQAGALFWLFRLIGKKPV